MSTPSVMAASINASSCPAPHRALPALVQQQQDSQR
jgi:hypothetical protein